MLKKTVGILIVLSFLIISTTSHADVKLKIAVVNPSPSETQTTPVRYDLPKGITPDQITDIGQMELKYDFGKNTYYLYKLMKLKPSEKAVLAIKLRDIWVIPQKDIDFLKNHTTGLVEKLKNTPHAKIGENLAGKIIERLNAIAKKEADQNLTMSEHINLYYENAGILSEVKEDIGMLENLVLDVGGIVEDRVQVPATLAVPIKGEEATPGNTLELMIKVSNPSKTDKQTTNLKYMLPEEVAPRYVVDRGDLGMGYDFSKQAFYVYKDNIALKPSEVKNYVVKLKDIWYIADVETDTLKAHTENLMLLLKDTDYLPQAKPLADKIDKGLSEIKAIQAMKVQADEHIADYRKDLALLEEVKQSVAQLEKLTNQSGASAGVTIKEAEVERGGGTKEKRARGYEGIDFIVKSIFKGKAPSVATTWRIIFIILTFIGLLAALFFLLWYIQAQRAQKREEEAEDIRPKSEEKKSE